jgi:hypothetical protein
MATAPSQPVDQWFVRQGAKIRGPFSLAVLASMRERGRIDPATQISADRLHWVAARTVSELFGESDGSAANCAQQPDAIVRDVEMPPSLAASHAIGCAAALDPSLKCFYSIDGIVHGPVPFTALRQRAASRQLAPTDYVWIEGTPDWLPALSVAELSVPTHQQRTASFLRSNAVMVSCIVGMALLVLGLPTWYVFASSRQKQKEMAAQAQAEKDLQQRKEADQKKEISRLEGERDRLFAQERSLLSDRSHARMQLEMLRVEKTRDERIEARMDELGLQLAKLDRDIADVRSAQSRNQQAIERQGSLVQGQLGHEEMERHRKREAERQRDHERELAAQRDQEQNDLAQIEASKRRAELEEANRLTQIAQQMAQAQNDKAQAQNERAQANIGKRVRGGGLVLFGGWRGVVVEKINNSFYRVKITDSHPTLGDYVAGRSYEMSTTEFEFLDD